MDNFYKGEFVHFLIDTAHKLECVRDDIKNHPKGNSIYGAMSKDYINEAVRKIRELSYRILDGKED